MAKSNKETVAYRLSERSYRKAAEFASRESETQLIRVTYLNVLARMAVKTYLRRSGFEISLQDPPAWGEEEFFTSPPLVADRAHLHVRGAGALECRPILPKQPAAILPPQAQSPRVGAVLVEIDEARSSVKILGFSRGYVLPRAPHIPLVPLLLKRQDLESPARLNGYLATVQRTTTDPGLELPYLRVAGVTRAKTK